MRFRLGDRSERRKENPGAARNLLELKELQRHPPAFRLPWTPGAPTAWGR